MKKLFEFIKTINYIISRYAHLSVYTYQNAIKCYYVVCVCVCCHHVFRYYYICCKGYDHTRRCSPLMTI